MSAQPTVSNLRLGPTLTVFAASGLAALIFEVLWMRWLNQLCGGTAESAAVTTAVLFAGIAAGSWFWGSRSHRSSAPLATFARLELAVAASAATSYALANHVLPDLGCGDAGPVPRLIMAVALIGPASFFMGGTLPYIGQHLLRQENSLSTGAGLLYGVNTLGAVIGAVAAGFLLPLWLGFAGTYLTAGVISLSAGLGAFMLAQDSGPDRAVISDQARPEFPTRLFPAIAFASGFLALAQQVLWIRMLSQVLQNSSYTFATVLAVYLLGLAAGALAVHQLARRALPASMTMIACVAGLACLGSAFAFSYWTPGLAQPAVGTDLTTYLLRVVAALTLIIGLPVAIMGMLLPTLYRETAGAPGNALGYLNGWNLTGAVVGSLAAAFVLLPLLGLWQGVTVIAFGYLAIGVISADSLRPRMTAVAIIAFSTITLDPTRLPTVRLDGIEQILSLEQGPDGTVAVIGRGDDVHIRLNNTYSLGGSGARPLEVMQAHLPLRVHPAERVLFLGMGTGITAGTALDYPVTQVDVVEVSASIIRASAAWMTPYTNGLHEDPRVRVQHADGRAYLRRSAANWDLIIADLYMPWRAGIGALYTVEHYAAAQARLSDQGVFVQWLPLYQLTENEFAIIVRTMASVFDRVTIWRGGFQTERPLLALFGHKAATALDANSPIVLAAADDLATLARSGDGDVPLLAHYIGSLPRAPASTLNQTTAAIAAARVSTLDRPWIEFLAPVSKRLVDTGKAQWLTGDTLLALADDLHDPNDPYLGHTSVRMRRVVEAGRHLHRAAGVDDAATRESALATARSLLGAIPDPAHP